MKLRVLLGVAMACLGLSALLGRAEISESQEAQSGIPWSIIATTNTTTGSYTYTNTVDHPWWLASTWYYVPVVGTNIWTVSHITKDETQFYAPATVTTNDWGVVETNDMHQLTNSVYVYRTNLLVNALASTTTPILKSVNDLAVPIPIYVYVRPGDLLQFDWSRPGYSWTGDVSFGWAGRK